MLDLMAKKQRRKFTEKELHQLEGYAMIRLPLEEIAILMKVSKETLERMHKADGAVREVLEGGRARSKGQIRQTLFQLAAGRVGGKTLDGQIVPPAAPDFQALKFWCQTQEGFKITDGLELSGNVSGIKDEELEARTQKALARMASRRKPDEA